MMLDKDRCALLVIDLQTKLLPAIDGHQQVLKNSLLLMRLAEVANIPVLLTTQYAKGLGSTVPEVLSAAPAVAPLDKASFGCFGDPGFTAALAGLGRRQLVVCGIEAHICVMQTVLGALEQGHEVHVASDATGSRSVSNWHVGLDRMARAGAVISSTEMALYELMARSDGDVFKRMLPHIKAL